MPSEIVAPGDIRGYLDDGTMFGMLGIGRLSK